MCAQLSNCPVKSPKLTQLLLEMLTFFFFFNLVTKKSLSKGEWRECLAVWWSESSVLLPSASLTGHLTAGELPRLYRSGLYIENLFLQCLFF